LGSSNDYFFLSINARSILLDKRRLGTEALERIGVAEIRVFGHVWRRPVDSILRRVDQAENILIARGRRTQRKL